MKRCEKQRAHDLDILRHGGAEAVILFMETARSVFAKGGAVSLGDWVGVAAPALPESERHATMTLLLRALLGDYDMVAEMQDERPTLQ